MNSFNSVVLIDSAEIIGIVRRALSKIDPRLIAHGERVAYIAKKIYEALDDKSGIDSTKLFILCLLHDIGAYKTNEIDDMVRFETKATFEHALYGCLFLKNTSNLSEYSDAILYHHTDYSELLTKNNKCEKYASIIFLADRADILFLSPNPNLSMFERMSGTVFNPEYVHALIKAEEKFGVIKEVSSGTYINEINCALSVLDIKNSEIMDYLKLLVYSIDFRSPYTVTHTADTTIMSVEIGRLMGLSDDELNILYIGAFLHDIGKIAISNTILEKPSSLTEQEFLEVKKHIDEGEQILRGVVSDEICDIALRHHEKLDGSGYSLGLHAKELTASQRIVAVADILSALSQKRSYKEPFSKDRVISILTNMKDTGKLCPSTVDMVCKNYDSILDRTEKSHDPIKLLYKNLLSEYAELYSNRL